MINWCLRCLEIIQAELYQIFCFNPILTGPSTSIILTGGLAGPTLFLKNGLYQPPGIDLLLIYKSFQPIWAFKFPTFPILAKICNRNPKNRRFLKKNSKQSKMEFDISKWRARWADYDYGRFFSLRQLFGALLGDFWAGSGGGPIEPTVCVRPLALTCM